MSQISIQGLLGEYQFNKHTYATTINRNNPPSTLQLISSRNPQKYSDRIIGKFILKQGYLAIVYGACNILLLEKLIKQKEIYGGVIFLIEVDSLFLAYLQKEYSNLFNSIICITQNEITKLKEAIDSINIENFLGYRILKNINCVQLNSEFYSSYEVILKKEISSRLSDLFTRLEFEPIWILNSLVQTSFFSKAKDVKELFNKGTSLKAILVSTGPSLRQDLNVLKKLQDKYFIACVDSAFQILYESGITPHLVFTLDCQAFTIRHFLNASFGTKDNFPILYADLVANPYIVSRWKGPLFVGMTAQYTNGERVLTPGMDYIESWLLKYNQETLGDIQSGGSVATSLFDLLRLMNFEEIILLGQDLAYSYREIHCMGTHHNKEWFSKSTSRLQSIENINNQIIQKRQTNKEVSISGKKIVADYILSLYAQWFEDAIDKLHFNVYNASQEGLLISSAKPIQLNQWILTKKSLSQATLKNITYWTNSKKKYIIRKNLISRFQEDILNCSYKKETNQKFYFLNFIARKYQISKIRKNIQNQNEIKILDNNIHRERELFFNKLKDTIINLC